MEQSAQDSRFRVPGWVLAGAAVLIAVAIGGVLLVRWQRSDRRISSPPVMPSPSQEKMYTVQERLEQYGPAARARILPFFAKAQISYPPARIVLLGLKSERVLHVYAAGSGDVLKLVRSYPILGASGVLGPKLREGDRQVPEGIYAIELLNPNSRHRLSLRVNYPNEFDRAMAAREGRQNLGGDIMIHGGRTSIGCLAIGDDASEEVFVLAADTGLDRIKVILSPVDFRVSDLPASRPAAPSWSEEIYRQIRDEMKRLPRAP